MRRHISFLLALPLCAACGANRPVAVATAPTPVPANQAAQPPTAPRDPVLAAIAAAEAAFEAGTRAIEQGHLRDARVAFDSALDTLLLMPGGARSDARLSTALDALVDRITAVELAALASGD